MRYFRVFLAGLLASLGGAAVTVGTAVRNEVPGAQPGGGWSLQHVPLAGATCHRNGVYQLPGADYVLTGNLIASNYWQPGDTLACDYEW